MTDGNPKACKVVVIGAGLAGLCCARTLLRAGLEVHLYEAADAVGGRVRTDVVDGFRLDRGFQVLFTAYPAVQQELDLDRLDLKPFEPGALVLWNGESYPISDPFRRPKELIKSVFSGLFPFSDKKALLRLRKLLKSLDLTDIFLLPDQNIHEFLTEQGFSPYFLDNFVRPFYGGVFLHRGLETSARMFALVFKMLIEGDAAVPAGGMNAIPAQIAKDLSPGTIHLKSTVVALIRDEARVTGIRLADDTVVEADIVVVATPADIAAHLTGLKLPQEKRSTTCVYFEIPRPFTPAKSLMLFTEPNKYAGKTSLYNNAAIMTNVAPGYAPEGRHLLSATIIGEPKLTDEQMVAIARREIGNHFKNSESEQWRLLRVYRIPWAQFAQPAGIFGRLPQAATGVPGLILSGEIICHSSIQGALEAGQKAAAEVLYETGNKQRPKRRKALPEYSLRSRS